MPGVYLGRGAYATDAAAAAPTAATADAMDISLRCGLLLLGRGAASVDVESAVHAVAVALGLQGVEVDITYTAITLTVIAGTLPTSATRVVRVISPDYARLTEAHRFVLAVSDGSVPLRDARWRLAELERAPKAYPRWVVTAARATSAAAIATTLGGTALVALSAFVVAATIDQIGQAQSRSRLPEFFVVFVGGLVAGAAAAALTASALPVRSALVVASSIVILLPGVLLVTAVRDAIVGFPLTASARGLEVAVIITGIVGGVLAATSAATLFGVVVNVVPGPQAAADTLVVRTLAAGVTGMAFSVGFHAPRRLLLPAGGVAAAGFVVASVLGEQSGSAIAGTALSAVLIGALATLVTRRAEAPVLVLVVAGVLPQLPGLAIYRGAVELSQGSTVQGIVTLLGAIVVAVALAAGALFGELLVSRVRRPRAGPR
jgi:uncharacterized membrane protein YjjP (DUF1212 family)